MNINILNYSNHSKEEIINWADGLLDNLKIHGVDIEEIEIGYLETGTITHTIVKDYIDNIKSSSPLLKNEDFLIFIGEHFKEGDAVVILGEELIIQNAWGDELSGPISVAIIRRITKKNIWHEIAHLLGAGDHYEEDSYKKKDICTEKDCIMQYGKDGDNTTFCSEAIKEIKQKLINTL